MRAIQSDNSQSESFYNHFTLLSRRFNGIGRSEEGQAMKEVLIDGEKFKICAQLNHFTAFKTL